MRSTFNMTAKQAEEELRRGEIASLGTEWVAPGEGSTWQELVDAFRSRAAFPMGANPDATTNLKLRGTPLTSYDHQRWESGKVE